MNGIVSVENVTMKYQTKHSEIEALRKISFTVQKGEFVSIVGPSGCGKSTLLSLISGLQPCTEGCIRIADKTVDGPADNIGYMLQSDQLFEWRTILKNVLLGAELRRRNIDIKYAEALLKKYGLFEFRNNYPSELSGGMRQRCALIRTLLLRPDLLLLDEAFSGLDAQTRLAVSEDIYSIIKSEGMTAIMVTHDIYEALSLSDRVIVLSARPAEILSDRSVPFSASALSPIRRRELPACHALFEEIWKELAVHVR